MKKTIVTLAVLTFIFSVIFESTVFAVNIKDNINTYEEITAETFASLRTATEKELREHLSKYYAITSYPDNESIFGLTSLEDEDNTLLIYKPAFTTYHEADILLFINSDGTLMKLKVGEDLEMVDIAAESAHLTVPEGKVLMRNYLETAYTYEADTGKIEKWNIGKVEDTWNVTTSSKYCGFSDDVGYIFRDGGDVYAFTADSFFSSTLEKDEVVKIAEGVEMVLVMNYWYSEDHYGVPLFLMQDKSIKAYVNTDALMNNTNHRKYLCTPIYEGGYGYIG